MPTGTGRVADQQVSSGFGHSSPSRVKMGSRAATSRCERTDVVRLHLASSHPDQPFWHLLVSQPRHRALSRLTERVRRTAQDLHPLQA